MKGDNFRTVSAEVSADVLGQFYSMEQSHPRCDRPIEQPPKREPAGIPPRVLALIQDVARDHEVAVKEMVGQSHRRIPSRARFEAYHRIRHEILFRSGPPSLVQIGAWFNGRDHSSVLYGLKVHAREAELVEG